MVALCYYLFNLKRKTNLLKYKPRVLLIGGLPRPSGGVTVFLGRLVNQIGGEIDFHVLDIHAGEKEPTLAKSLEIAPRLRLLKQLWLIWKICIFRGDIVHFNHSSCHALIALAFLPKLGRKFYLTLHNGSQLKKYQGFSKFTQSLVHKAASKIDCVFSLCEDHTKFYNLVNVENSRIINTKSQISALDVTPGFVDEKHAALKMQYRHLVISSGHVSRTYNFEFLVRFVNDNPDCAGLLFFYGEHIDEAYLAELKREMIFPERFSIYFHQSEAVFLSALATASAYLRPTHVDSWGIAVADAIAMGVPSIASSVCERAPGAILCSPNDYLKFSHLVSSEIRKKINKLVIKDSFSGKDFLKSYFNC